MNPYLILSIIIAYFLVLLLISIFTSRKADSDSFFIGNKTSPWYIVAFGMIGASLSGVTFISVPGWVLSSNFYYMQMVLGYMLGYAVIVHVLLPVYYRLNLTSIYTYLEKRFGKTSYKTGAFYFLISRLIGASFRLFIVANVLQLTVFAKLNIRFELTIVLTLLFIYIYTFKGGIKTIVWTDMLQTFFMLLAVVLSVIYISRSLDFSFTDLLARISESEYSTVFNMSDWREVSFFPKQFFSGVFMAIAMTGLDQDMMQKNLSCRNLRDSQKNVYWYGSMFVPVNLLFLGLGVLLIIFSQSKGLVLPLESDDLFPSIVTGNFPGFLAIIFLLGLIAAAYSSADSALTSLTTSFTVDILEAKNLPEKKLKRLRWTVHIGMSVLIGIIIMAFKFLNNEAVIKNLFAAASYTYGPLLGLFAFGLITKLELRDKWVPLVALLSPGLTFLFKLLIERLVTNYEFAYEILIINGIITVLGLFIISRKTVKKGSA